jgi:type I restriction-modification system DNA methylase subunit
MDTKDPLTIGKLCKEGAYSLINRVLFLRICEDKDYIKPKLSKVALVKWKQMVEKPSHLLDMAFGEIGERFKGLYRSPLFDNIKFEDIRWNEEVVSYILDRLGEHDFSKITKDILGRAYEQHISEKERKALGQFYTPDFVIDYILDRVGVSPNKSILDPACGSGGFLMKAYDRLREMYRKEGWADEKIHRQILSQNLFGIDINPFATQLTTMNLLLKDLDHPTGEINVVEGDTLEKIEESFAKLSLEFRGTPKETPIKVLTGTGKEISYFTLLQKAPFDIVIGNPPYISFGLRGVDKIAKGKMKELKMYFPHSAEYKISIYALFVERGLQLLKEGGRLGFILPDSFLLGKYFQGLRKYILNTCKVKEIVLFEKDFWKYGVVGRPVILILEKEFDEKLRLTNKVIARYYTAQGFKSNSYEQSYFHSEPRLYRFRLFFSKRAKELVEAIEKQSIRLSEVVSIHTGVRSKIGQKKIISKEKLGSSWEKGLISGSEIGRYSLRYGGHFLNIDSDLLWKGGWDPDIVMSDKLLLRQTEDDIIGTLDEEHYYHLNNIHAIALKDKKYNLKYILAILNSRLLNHYYHLISLEKGRAMAQIDIDAIEQLPIKPASPEKQKEFVALVNKILELSKSLNNLISGGQKEKIQKEIRNIDNQIDRKVFELYSIKPFPITE